MKKILAFLVLAAVCCHAQTAPSAELIVTEGIVAFHDKTTVQFDMKDHAKSKGASMKMRLPKNWTASEGDRPNVVQKFTSPSKNEMVTIVTRKLVPEDGVSVEEAVKELFTEEALKQCAPEGALLCPQIVAPSRSKRKYDDVTLYLLTYRGVLASQVRDLFSAGSVALRADQTRGGTYIKRSLEDIQAEMSQAADSLPEALFEEYWGEVVPRENRIRWWLAEADKYAVGWKPSHELFLA